MVIINFLNTNFPDFNPENEQDLIRAEKILKAEQKINQNFKSQDIEEVISFYKNYGNRYQKFLTNKKFMNIFLNNNPKIIWHRFNFGDNDKEKLWEFGNIFEHEILKVIKKNINKNYQNLEYFITEYKPAINIHCNEFIAKTFSDRLQIIAVNLHNSDYKNFYSEYSFAFNPDFYKCISTFDADFFENDILRISKFGEQESRDKKENIATGKILHALSYFKSSNQEISQYLQYKKGVAYSLRKDEETLFSKLEERLQKSWVEKEDSWNDIFLAIFCFSLFIGTFVSIYLYLPNFVFLFEFGMTIILFFAFLGAPNNWGVHEYDTSEYSFIRHFKKFSLSLYIIFRYILFVLIMSNILLGIIAFFAYITI